MLRFLPNMRCVLPNQFCVASFLVLTFITLAPVWAKDVPITGVLLIKDKDVVSYVQISGLLINGKTELRACTSATSPIDKSAYKSLTKVNLGSLKMLERMPDGSFQAQIGTAPASCVVPGNYKFDKDGALTPSDLIDKSTFTGQVLGSLPAGTTGIPAFSREAKFVFGSATDAELAEFLMAQRAERIPTWRVYLGKYPTAPHVGVAKTSLARLLVTEGLQKLSSYKKSAASPAPLYEELKGARESADQAIELTPTDEGANHLREDVRQQLKDLCDKAATKLQAFRDATSAHTHGYDLFLAGQNLSERITFVDGTYPPGITIKNNVAMESRSIDAAIQTADSFRASKQFDNAYAAISKYQWFAGEEPRLKQIVHDTYKYHFDKGNEEAKNGNWQDSVTDLRKASEIEPTAESKSSLAQAQAGLLASENKVAADRALAHSQEALAEKDVISAYEVLAQLNGAQQTLVRDNMVSLQDAYVKAATERAKELQTAHTPIRGKADEDAVRQAYDYIQRATKLSDDPELGIKLDFLGDTISKYYIELAKKYLNKPLSSGVGIGWLYLTEARQYRRNLDTISDEMTRNSAAYQMRSKLSVGVLFRDQTSRRDSESLGFADQLQQAFATGLETSGLPVQVILPQAPPVIPPGSTTPLQPNFKFVGEILQHRPIRSMKKDTLQSEYRSGSREIPNQEWNKADQQYETASLELQKVQSTLVAAQTKNNKKQIEEAENDLASIQKTVQKYRSQMNSIPKTNPEDLVSPYNYTRTTLELTNIIELSFQIKDANSNPVGEPIRVVKGEQAKKFTILDNVKPEDTKGVKEIDSPPDEQQLMNDVEIEARDSIVKAARDRVQDLPEKILMRARERSSAGDLDGAGELYVLYLNCTSGVPTHERTEAARFLAETFNLRTADSLSASSK